jgi:protein-tyrosine-phosphatase
MSRHVLFLCTGNLCRSPIAEGILKQELAKRRINSVTVSSAGTFALTGQPAAELAVEVAAERAVDLSSHRSRHVTRQMLKSADLVIGMERDHLMEAGVICRDSGGKYYLLTDFGPPHVRGSDIEDPYGAPIEYFISTYEEIERYVKALLDDFVQKWGLSGPAAP